MREIYSSIDIGTDEIKIVVMEYLDNKYNVLASSCVKSAGVKQGLIVDATLITNAIKKCVKQAESKLGTKIDKLIAVVPSNNINIIMGDSKTKIDTVDSIVNGDILFSGMQKCLKGNTDPTKEVVGVFPVEYTIDKTKKVKNPLGLEGKELELKSVIVEVPKKNVYSVISIIEGIGIEVTDILISSIGDYYVLKNQDLDSKVVSIINIGKEKSVLSVFNKGIIIKEKVIKSGSNVIDKSIISTYSVDDEEVDKIVKDFAVANRKYADNDEVYTCKNSKNEQIEINNYKLAESIEYQIVELLKMIKIELNNLTNKEIDYIIITGGITSILGFNAIVEELFPKNVTILNTNVIGIRDNKYVTCYGAIRYFVNKLELREKEYTMFTEEKINEMIVNGKKMGNSSVLGKIFDRIFD